MIEAGFAQGSESFIVTANEINEMPQDEWALLQRLLTESIKVPNTELKCWKELEGNAAVRLHIDLIRHVPSVTSLGDYTEVPDDVVDDILMETQSRDAENTFYFGGYTFPRGTTFDINL